MPPPDPCSLVRLDEPSFTPLTFTFEGRPIPASPGDTVAAALLAAGERHWRDAAASGAPRGPWCLMGSCFECVMLIDGVSRQACMTVVRDGMRIKRRARLHDLGAA